MNERTQWWWPFLELAGVIEASPVLAKGAEDTSFWTGAAASGYQQASARERATLLRLAVRLRHLALAARAHAELGEDALDPLLAVIDGFVRDSLSTNRAAVREPDEVRRWWDAASPQQQLDREVVLGPALAVLPGVPVAVRDRLNRRLLGQDVALGRVSKREAAPLTAPGRTLITYTSTAPGKDATAVVAVGDVERASRVAVLVPGVGTDLGDAAAQMKRVERLLEPSGHDTAGLWWLGYDAPDGPGDPAMFTGTRARDAGADLAQELEMLADLRRDVPQGRTTVVGHSYGSTVMANALTGQDRAGGEAPVDAAVFVGSPGAGAATHAGDVDADEVYAVRNPSDLVAMLGDDDSLAPTRRTGGRIGLGVDPANESFGAVGLDGGEGSENPWPDAHRSHTGYFAAGSDTLADLRQVVAGEQGRRP